MKTIGTEVSDPYICSCLPQFYYLNICSKIKWSTISITISLLIIIIYLSSGLHALIDVTTIISAQTSQSKSDASLWPILSSSWSIVIGWISVSVYLGTVLLITVLLCGIQLNKPWLLLLWSITMVFMVLADGIITILSLREHQQHNYRSTAQVKILFLVMAIRLVVSLIGIFLVIFHFRRLSRFHLEEKSRQILDRYNDPSPTTSYQDSWARYVSIRKPSSDIKDDQQTDDLLPPLALPRAKVGTVQDHPVSTMFHTYNSSRDYRDRLNQQPIDAYHDDFRYNIPLQERFHQQQTRNSRGF